MSTPSDNLNNNVFTILGIPPTDNFTQVKKAYFRKALELHPDKNPQISDEQFKTLQNAYEVVNSPENLRNYYNTLKDNPDIGVPSNTNNSSCESNSSATFNEKEESQGIKAYQWGEVDIYIPIPFYPKFHKNPEMPVPLMPYSTDRIIDFDRIAQFITLKSQEGISQIGVTEQEAKDIINQHKHHYPYLIAKVSISINRLSEVKSSESDMMGSGILNAKSEKNFFWLQENTVIKSSDIISINALPSNEYRNTQSFYSGSFRGHTIEEYWPQGLTVTHESQSEIRNKIEIKEHENQNLFCVAEKEVTRLKSKPTAFMSHNRHKIEAIEDALKSKDPDAVSKALDIKRHPHFDAFFNKGSTSSREAYLRSKESSSSNNQDNLEKQLSIRKS